MSSGRNSAFSSSYFTETTSLQPILDELLTLRKKLDFKIFSNNSGNQYSENQNYRSLVSNLSSDTIAACYGIYDPTFIMLVKDLLLPVIVAVNCYDDNNLTYNNTTSNMGNNTEDTIDKTYKGYENATSSDKNTTLITTVPQIPSENYISTKMSTKDDSSPSNAKDNPVLKDNPPKIVSKRKQAIRHQMRKSEWQCEVQKYIRSVELTLLQLLMVQKLKSREENLVRKAEKTRRDGDNLMANLNSYSNIIN